MSVYENARVRQKHVFLLGGRDLEMETIRVLLEAHVPGQFIDKGLAWGATLADYFDEIRQAHEEGRIPVAIELDADPLAAFARCRHIILIDHHGKRAGEPTSLDQVFDFLGLDRQRQWTRWFELVAANDGAYIEGMVKVGASAQEVLKVRQAEWRALGYDGQTEAGVRQALRDHKKVEGRLTLVTIANNASPVVADLLHERMGGVGFDNLLVVQPTKLSFSGDGILINKLSELWSKPSFNSWYGGRELERQEGVITGGRGYWGIEEHDESARQAVIAFIQKNAID